MGVMGTTTGYHIDSLLTTLIKKLTYQGITYSRKGPVNYSKLCKLVKKNNEFFHLRSLLGEDIDLDEIANFENIVWYDDIKIDKSDKYTSVAYAKNHRIYISQADMMGDAKICLFNYDRYGDHYDEAVDDQTIMDIIEWKNKLIASGRLPESSEKMSCDEDND